MTCIDTKPTPDHDEYGALENALWHWRQLLWSRHGSNPRMVHVFVRHDRVLRDYENEVTL